MFSTSASISSNGPSRRSHYCWGIERLHSRQHISWRVITTVLVFTIAVIGWLVAPAFEQQPGVLLYGDTALQSSTKEVNEQLRDRGLTPNWSATSVDSWCAAASQPFPAVPSGADRLVLSFAERGTCEGDPVGAVLSDATKRDLTPVVVVEPAAFDPLRRDVATVYTATLLGPTGTADMPCEWWDGCGADTHVVAVRDAEGALTDAGRGRLARMLTMAVGS